MTEETSRAAAELPGRAERRAKIMATLGPASSAPDRIRELLLNGVDVVRLNLAHGDRGEQRAVMEHVRAIAGSLGRHIAVLADLGGPRYRVASLDAPLLIEPGATLVIADDGGDLPLARPGLAAHLRVGDRVLIADGAVELRIERASRGRAEARVIRGGSVGSGKGINLPETDLPYVVSERDQADIALCIEGGVDLIGASYVGSAADVRLLRDAISAAGGAMPIVAKIERAAAAARVDEIAAAADAVMVARGDLGLELPLEEVPPLQKRIVALCRDRGTPVIVATDMLASMIDAARPTRAEVSDVANAVLEGADVLMLSGETAIGRHPVAAVRMMDRVITRAERSAAAAPPMGAGRRLAPAEGDIPGALAAAAARAAEMVDVRVIVAVTRTGATARLVARYRPSTPIVALTPDAAVARRAQLLWGVDPAVVPALGSGEDVIAQVERELLRSGRVRPGDTALLLMGAPVHTGAPRDLVRIHRVGA